jgi:hypothetical protein
VCIKQRSSFLFGLFALFVAIHLTVDCLLVWVLGLFVVIVSQVAVQSGLSPVFPTAHDLICKID